MGGWFFDVVVGWFCGSVALGLAGEGLDAIAGTAPTGNRVGIVGGTILGIWFMRRTRARRAHGESADDRHDDSLDSALSKPGRRSKSPKRHRLRNTLAGFVAVLVILGVIGSHTHKRATAHVVSVQDLCNQFFNTTIRILVQRLPDSQVTPLIRGLANAGRTFDVVTATDIQAIANDAGASPAVISADSQVVFRRCTALGFPATPDQVSKIQSLTTTPIPAP